MVYEAIVTGIVAGTLRNSDLFKNVVYEKL